MGLIKRWNLESVPLHQIETLIVRYCGSAIPVVVDEEVFFPLGDEKLGIGIRSRKTNSGRKILELEGIDESNSKVQEIKTYLETIRDTSLTADHRILLFSDLIVNGSFNCDLFSISNLPEDAPVGDKIMAGVKRPFFLATKAKHVDFGKGAEEFGKPKHLLNSQINSVLARSKLREIENVLSACLLDPIYEMKKDHVWVNRKENVGPLKPEVAEIGYFYPHLRVAPISDNRLSLISLDKYFKSRSIVDYFLTLPENMHNLIAAYSKLDEEKKSRVQVHGRWKTLSRLNRTFSPSLSFMCLFSSIEALTEQPASKKTFDDFVNKYLHEYHDLRNALYSLRGKVTHGGGLFDGEQHGAAWGTRNDVLQTNYSLDLRKAITIAFHRWLTSVTS